MKIALLIICCVLAILKQNADGATVQKKKVQPADDTEPEEIENKSITLVDLIEKTTGSKEDYNVSLMKKRPVQKKNSSTTNNKKKPKSIKTGKKKNTRKPKQSKRNSLLLTYPTPLESDIQDRLAHANSAKQSLDQSEDIENNRIDKTEKKDDSLNSAESAEQRIEKSKQKVHDNSANSVEGTRQDNGLIRRTLGGSVEDETVEDGGGRKALDQKRKFEEVYRYENEPLKQMLAWLVMNAMTPSTKDVIKASKTSVDRYVKATVDKAGAQAALRYTDYSSLRFDKDRIMIYCGGQMYVYNTLKDSKICFNGQVYEVRLI